MELKEDFPFLGGDDIDDLFIKPLLKLFRKADHGFALTIERDQEGT
jgi:hypothetical protein